MSEPIWDNEILEDRRNVASEIVIKGGISEAEALERVRGGDRERDDEREPAELERPTFRGARDAFADLEHRRAEAAEEQRQSEEDRAAGDEHAAERRVRDAASWSADERQALADYAARVEDYNRTRQGFAEIVRAAGPNLSKSPAAMEAVRHAAAQLRQHHDTLSEVPALVQQANAAKVRATAAAILHRQVPELATQEGKDRLVRWLGAQGVTREAALSEGDPQKLALAWKEMVRDQRQQEASRKRSEAARQTADYAWKHLRRGQERTPENAQQARERLRRSGSIEDALGVLHMRRIERRAAE